METEVISSVFKTSLFDFVSLIVLLGLLVASAVCSASETAIFSLSPNDFNEIRSKKNGSYKWLLKLLETPKRTLATILIANNLVNVAIVILSTFLVHRAFSFENYPVLAFLFEVVIITSLLLLFGEVLPKIYASQYPLKTAVRLAPVIVSLSKAVYPMAWFLVRSTSVIDKRIAKKSSNISIDELSEAIDIATNESNTEMQESKILKGIVKFGDIDVSEIMRSRVDVDAVESSLSFKDLMKKVLDSGYSRMPVYKESLDNIAGILFIKDLLAHINDADDFDWLSVVKPAFFVPENKKIDTLLADFQEKKTHLAIVVDEYGGTSGIITLEDVMEEVLGDIHDEFDSESDKVFYRKINENTWLFDGKISLNDFCKIVNIDDETFDSIRGDAESLAGLILEKTGTMPHKNDKIIIKPFAFFIEALNARRIERIRVTR